MKFAQFFLGVLFFITTPLVALASVNIIDDATGGDCVTIGVWDSASKTCTINTDLDKGITVGDGSNGITLDGNGHSLLGSGFGESGIELSNSNAVTIENFDIENFEEGIDLFNSSSCVIKNNKISNSWNDGISAFDGSNNNVFTNNNIQANDGDGIGLFGASGNTISNNNFVGDNDGTAFYDNADNNIATGNTLYKNLTEGLLFFGSHDNLVKENSITENASGIYFYDSTFSVYNNNFTGNLDAPYGSIAPDAQFDASLPLGGNYWSEDDEPTEGCIDANNDNICDSPYIFDGAQDNYPWKIPNGWAPPLKTGNSNVVFIPGLESSRLYKRGLLFENQLWEPNWNADVEKLYLDSNGNSLDPNIYTNDIIKRTNISLGVFDVDIYKKFADTMDNLVADKKINGWEALPYDWRFDINKIIKDGAKMAGGGTLNFVDEVIKNAGNSASGKVTIVAHSNGGLIAKALINELKAQGKENLVDKLILIASPQLGTPESVVGVLHGDEQERLGGWLLNKSTARTMGENMMGAYNLLPEGEYFTKVAEPIVKFDKSINSIPGGASMITRYGSTIDSALKLKEFFLGAEGRSEPADSDTDTPNVLKPNLLNLAQSNHITLDSWTPPNNIKVIQLAGWGVETIAGIEYFGRETCSPSLSPCVPVTMLDRRPIYTEDGDKTVVTPSATAINGASVYYLNIPKENKDFNMEAEHGTILEATSTIQFITNFVLGENQDVSNYISSAKPTSTDKTLELALHSPVSIDVYDGNGNHTGLVNNPNQNSDLQMVEESVPGSRYLDFGEGKYVLLDSNGRYSIKLQGLDFGTFTLETNETLGGVELATSTFIDIPTSPLMAGEVVIGSTTAPIINIDANGDGKTDFIVNGTQEFDPIAYLQILKKTVETFDANKKTKEEVTKKIDSIIKSLQKGKTAKAILKIKSFGKELSIKTEARRKEEDIKHKKERDWKNKKHNLNKNDAEALLAMLNRLLDNLIK